MLIKPDTPLLYPCCTLLPSATPWYTSRNPATLLHPASASYTLSHFATICLVHLATPQDTLSHSATPWYSLPYLEMPCHTLPHLKTPRHTLLHSAKLCYTMIYLIKPCHNLPYLATPCQTPCKNLKHFSYLAIPCHTLLHSDTPPFCHTLFYCLLHQLYMAKMIIEGS